MTYKKFLQTMPVQPDPRLEAIRIKFKDDHGFPETSDVKEISHYVYNKLTPDQQTTSFQKTLVVWGMQTGKAIDLNDLNYVIDLQDKK
jgi:hypothetical protein